MIDKLSTVRPQQGTWPQGARTPQIHSFFGSKIFFQIHGFPNVGHSFTPQLYGYELGPMIKRITRFLSYTVFQNTLKQCNSGPYCSLIKYELDSFLSV